MNTNKTNSPETAITAGTPTVAHPKRTTLTTIVVMLLREHRLVRGIGMPHLSEMLGYPDGLSAWSKIECGKRALKLQTMWAASQALSLQASQIIDQAEKMSIVLACNGWKIVSECHHRNLVDDLFAVAKDHKEKGFTQVYSAHGCVSIPSVVLKALQG